MRRKNRSERQIIVDKTLVEQEQSGGIAENAKYGKIEYQQW